MSMLNLVADKCPVEQVIFGLQTQKQDLEFILRGATGLFVWIVWPAC